MNKYSLENYSRPILQMPHGRKKLLLHSCCAPCAGEIMEAVAASDIDNSIFLYNTLLSSAIKSKIKERL